MALLDAFSSPRFIRFVMAGGLAALVNFGSRIGFSQFVSFRWAVLLAYLVGMTTAFILSKRYVFEKSSQTVTRQFYYFSLVNVFAAIQVWVISVGLAEYAFVWLDYRIYREELAHLIGITVPVFTSYLGHKHLSFRR